MCSKQDSRLKFKFSNIITGINESKSLTKHVSSKSECKFNGRKCNSNQKQNKNKCRLSANKQTNKQKNMCAKKIIFGILLHVLVKMNLSIFNKYY